MDHLAGHAPRSVPRPPRPLTAHAARVGAGVLLTLTGLVVAGAATHSSLIVAPFAATAALKHAAPHARLARPRNVIGGYLIGASAGFGVGLLAPGPGIATAIAAGLAATAMSRLDVEHPPAVAMAVIAVELPVPWMLQVAAAGALVMTASTVLLSPLLHRRVYPRSAARLVGDAPAA